MTLSQAVPGEEAGVLGYSWGALIVCRKQHTRRLGGEHCVLTTPGGRCPLGFCSEGFSVTF